MESFEISDFFFLFQLKGIVNIFNIRKLPFEGCMFKCGHSNICMGLLSMNYCKNLPEE